MVSAASQDKPNPASQPDYHFSLADILTAAEGILRARPDPIPAYRLLNEVLRRPGNDPELREARQASQQSKWLQQLIDAQLPDGSWGRFHSQDTLVKSAFRTSEEAIDRAFSLGLGSDHPVLGKARQYIENVVAGRVHISDWAEKNEAWPLLIRFILMGRLAQIEPNNRILDDDWECLSQVARRTFASGEYRLEDEAQAFLQVANTHVPQGFLESQHALWILSSRPLPVQLEQSLVEWIWNKPDGFRYLRAALPTPPPRLIAYWLRSMNILTRFASWRQVSAGTLNWLWEQRDEQGLWDFGSRTAWCIDFPISDSWRVKIKRKVDYSTGVLALLRKAFDQASR